MFLGKWESQDVFLDSSQPEKTLKSHHLRKVVDNLKMKNISSIIVLGGRSSLEHSQKLIDLGFKVVGIPSTIQDDIVGTDITLGTDTACNNIVKCIGSIKSLGIPINRVFIVGVEGEFSGNLAMRSSIAAGIEICLHSNEENLSLDTVLTKIVDQRHHHFITLVTPCWKPGKKELVKYLRDHEDENNIKVVDIHLGFIQRGGPPSGFDRLLGTNMGSYAVEALQEGLNGVMVGYQNSKYVYVSFSEVFGKIKPVSDVLVRQMKINE